ncbi:MAG: sugar phosphate isomerase/epimerase [Peptostreptococcaceae bacterium]|nr:sugar phosphate isomerase/epimerase [Peptostreptococcaceae bacterium]
MNNKLAIHYGSFVTNWNNDQMPLISRVKSIGFDMLEFGALYLRNLNDEQIKTFKNEAEKYNIALTLSLGLSPVQDIGSPNKEYRKAGMNVLKDVALAMTKCGISDCSGIIHGSWNGKIDSYDEKKEYWENSVTSMKEASKVFSDLGVYFNIEVVNRFENFLINSCDEALAYLDEVDSPNLGIHLDTFHMNIEEDSMVSAIFKAKDRLRYFHIGENNRKFPGLGSMPWKTIFETLKIIEYKNPIGMEPFVRPGGEVGSAVSLYREIMKITDYDEHLKDSITYIRNLMA